MSREERCGVIFGGRPCNAKADHPVHHSEAWATSGRSAVNHDFVPRRDRRVSERRVADRRHLQGV